MASIEQVRTDWNTVDVAEAQSLADAIIEQGQICEDARTAQTAALNKYVNDKLDEFDVWQEGEK